MIMGPSPVPGNQPDPDDMSTDPGVRTPDGPPNEHGLPEDDAEKLGDFA
jgi:hypothetical protein